MTDFYVYIYLDPRKSGKYKYGEYEFKYEPFYIGKGKDGRWKRINGRTEYFKRIINKIKKSRLKPIVIKIKENFSEEESFILELELINLIGRKDLKKGPLINYTNGGEGNSGYIHTEKSIKLMRENRTGKIYSEEIKRKISENHANVKGENHPRSVLTEKYIIQIIIDLMERKLTQKEIADKFGVVRQTISDIKCKEYGNILKWRMINVSYK